MYEELDEKAETKFQDLKVDGSLDKTHYNKYDTYVVAGMVAAAIKEKGLGLSKYLIAPAVTVKPAVAFNTVVAPDGSGDYRRFKRP
jgi:hypothetical protein